MYDTILCWTTPNCMHFFVRPSGTVLLILFKRPSHRKWCWIYYLTVSVLKPSRGFWTLKSEVWSPKSELFKSEEIWSSLYRPKSEKFKDRSSKCEGRGLSEVYPKFKIRTLSLKFKVWNSNSDVWSSKSVRSLKFEVWNSKSEVWCSKSGRDPKSKVGVWRLEVCPKFVWSLSRLTFN